jgi:hypothetical protein
LKPGGSTETQGISAWLPAPALPRTRKPSPTIKRIAFGSVTASARPNPVLRQERLPPNRVELVKCSLDGSG